MLDILDEFIPDKDIMRLLRNIIESFDTGQSVILSKAKDPLKSERERDSSATPQNDSEVLGPRSPSSRGQVSRG